MPDIGLGCAQLGMKYGNMADEMSEAEALAIVKTAYNLGIRFFDTARAYGKSEERLAKAKLPQDAIICSKMVAGWPKIDAHIIMLHKAADKDRIRIIGERVSEMGKEFGVSVYTLKEAYAAMACKDVKWLEVPINLVDHRFITDEFQAERKSRGIKLIARSILLQGVMARGIRLPDCHKKPLLLELRTMLDVQVQDAFDFVFNNCAEFFDIGIFGANNMSQLEQSYLSARRPHRFECLDDIRDAIEFAADHKLFDPRTWNQ